MKHLLILLIAALVIGLPFIFHRPPPQGEWRPGDPELIIVTPHNEAIRQEFAEAFSAWHQENYGKPVRIDWRALGGTTEIMRYLASEYAASAKRFLRAQGHDWPPNGAEIIFGKPPLPADGNSENSGNTGNTVGADPSVRPGAHAGAPLRPTVCNMGDRYPRIRCFLPHPVGMYLSEEPTVTQFWHPVGMPLSGQPR